ncbi:MAG: 2-oxoacid:acceptor oxidoreductase family protein [Candidatus Zixiibacteriota bacterium]|jgi:2-oxoglutarate ferredoxin oxidoreductase subunit gamma
MAFFYQIRLSGGADIDLHLASKILAEALAVYEDKNVVQHIAYGPEARGAAARTDLVVSDQEIYRPKAREVDLLVCLTQEAVDRYAADLGEQGYLLIDRDAVRRRPEGSFRTYELSFVEAARELGDPRLASIIVLGAVTVLSPAHHRRAVEDALLARVAPGTEDTHRAAFELGLKNMKEML